MKELRVESVAIENIKAIKKLEFIAGQVTVISGRNGVGKSSVLDAISIPFEGGHDASLLRRGAKSGSVSLGLSDGVTIKASVTEKGTTLKVTTKDGGLVKSPRTYIKNLTDGFAFDPIAFVEADPKKRLAFLLEAMPIEFPADQLKAAISLRAPLKAINLDDFNQLLDGLIETRRELGVEMRQLDGTIKSIEDMLPEEGEEDWGEQLAKIEGDIETLNNEATGYAGERDTWVEKQRAKFNKEHDAKAEELKLQLAKLEQERDNAISAAEKEAEKLYQEAVGEVNEQVTGLREKAATARQKAQQSTRSEALKEQLQDFRNQSQERQTQTDDLTHCIDNMRKLKTTILSELPIDGVDIREGEVYVENTPWPHVNTSEQYIVAAQVSALGNQKLPFKVLDRAEQLDEERFHMLAEGYKAAGLQLAVARVTENGELTVQPEAGEEPAGA